MPFVLGPAVEVRAQHLSESVFLPVQKNGEESFIKLAKTDRRMERLVCGHLAKRTGSSQVSVDRPFTKTNIVETLKTLHDWKVWDKIGTACKKRWNKKHKASMLVIQGSVEEIAAPAVGKFPAWSLKVMLSKPGSRRFLVELSGQLLEYLSEAVDTQFVSPDVDTIAIAKTRLLERSSANKGISELYDDGELCGYRARKVVGGKKQNMVVRFKNVSAELAIARVKAFVANGDEDTTKEDDTDGTILDNVSESDGRDGDADMEMPDGAALTAA